jgi:cytoskeletal protein CcmA (bactofilin family)
MLRAGSAVVVALAFALIASPAFAAEILQGDDVIVSSSEVIEDDVYAFGGTVEIAGTIEGDLVATGGRVVVTGDVEGSVNAAGGVITVSGDVGRSVRATGGFVEITGAVADDVFAAGGQVTLASTSEVGRDVIAAGGQVTINGTVEDDMQLSAGAASLNGEVGGDVEIQTETLTVGPGASIGGDLTYQSAEEADLPSGAVEGDIDWTQAAYQASDTGVESFSVLGGIVWAVLWWLRTLVGMAAFGIVFALMFRHFSDQAADTVRMRPWPSLFAGIGVLVLPGAVAMLVLVLGIMVGGWWLAFLILGLQWIAILAGVTISAVFVGRLVLRGFGSSQPHAFWSVLMGLVLIWLVLLVPVLGWFVISILSIFGIGGFTVALYERWRGFPAGMDRQSGSEEIEQQPAPQYAEAQSAEAPAVEQPDAGAAPPPEPPA